MRENPTADPSGPTAERGSESGSCCGAPACCGTTACCTPRERALDPGQSPRQAKAAAGCGCVDEKA